MVQPMPDRRKPNSDFSARNVPSTSVSSQYARRMRSASHSVWLVRSTYAPAPASAAACPGLRLKRTAAARPFGMPTIWWTGGIVWWSDGWGLERGGRKGGPRQ